MGTYTTNYNLFLPSIGEQGWGDLVNGNFSTIDTTISGLNTRIGTLETEADAVDERLATIEENISFDSNGDIVGNVVGDVTGRIFSTYTVTFSSTYFNNSASILQYSTGVSTMYLQPLPTITYSCPSTISVQINPVNNYVTDATTITVYTYNGVDWSSYSNKNTSTTASLSFPTSTKGVFIEVIGGTNCRVKFPLPIIT